MNRNHINTSPNTAYTTIRSGSGASSTSDSQVPEEASRRVVRAVKSNQWVSLTPIPWDALKSCLTSRHELGVAPSGGCQINRRAEMMFWRPKIPRDLVYISIGLWPIVRQRLQTHGYKLVDHVGQPLRLELPNTLDAALFWAVDASLLELVEQYERGTAYMYDGVDPAYLTAQIASAWPKHRIAVALKRLDDVRGFVRRLRRWIPEAKGVNTEVDDLNYPLARVIVGTYDACACNFNVGISWRDILVVPEAAEILGNSASRVLDAAFLARQYAFLPVTVCLAPQDADAIRERFGFQEIIIPRHGHRLRPVEVVWLRMVGGQAIDHAADLIGIKRQCVWQNPVRNRRIARLANAVATNDRILLESQFSAVSAAVHGNGPQRVAILVEGLEHAMELAHQLPEWEIVASPDARFDGMDAAAISRVDRSQCELMPTDRRIFTLGAVGRLANSRLDVLIRADAGTGLPPLAEQVGFVDKPELGPLCVVDFSDRHHPELRWRSRKRRRTYELHGWFAPGADPATERMRQFLESRPVLE